MASLLKIDVSPRGDYSVSHRLGEKFLAVWNEKNPEGTVVTRDLSGHPLPYVDLPWIAAAYSTPDQHTPEQKAAIKVSNELIDELFAADEIVINTPMYNFTAPAALKAWIDHVSRLDKTFNAKYEGLVKGKTVKIILASGGNYEPGAYMSKMDFFSGYMKSILGFMGMTDVVQYYASDTSAVSMGKIDISEYLDQHAPKMVAALIG
jgi:FMN-dependent NADH-azoreductase